MVMVEMPGAREARENLVGVGIVACSRLVVAVQQTHIPPACRRGRGYFVARLGLLLL